MQLSAKKDNMNMDPTIMGGLINPDIKQEGKTQNWKVVYFSECNSDIVVFILSLNFNQVNCMLKIHNISD